jgi:hypothetical protein
MLYYLYEVRNKINGKIYVGVHKTVDIDDGYMGSGKIIKRAIVKYGLDNFEKTVLETFASEEQMFLREKEFVNDEFLSRKDVYNLRRGGQGGFDYINKLGLNTKNIWSDEVAERRAKTRKDKKFQQGTNNTQFGTMWITDGLSNRKIPKDSVIPIGWRRGAIMSGRPKKI